MICIYINIRIHNYPYKMYFYIKIMSFRGWLYQLTLKALFEKFKQIKSLQNKKIILNRKFLYWKKNKKFIKLWNY